MDRSSRSQLAAPRATMSRESLLLCVILGLGLLLRGCYLAEVLDAPGFSSPALDAAFHDHWGRGLSTGDWSVPAPHADPHIQTTPYFRPPGYPYFLALIYTVIGSSHVAPRLVQMAMGLISCVLVFYLGRWMFGQAVGLLVALFTSVYWVFIYFEGELLSPPLLVFLGLALLNLLVRWTQKTTWLRVIGGGVLLGLFALVRPNILLFIPVVLVWGWWITRRRAATRAYWRTALGFLAGVAATVGPATIRNYVVADELVLISSNAGINLYIGNNEQTDCVWPHVPGLREIIGRRGWTSFDHARIVDGVQRTEGRTMTHAEVSAYYAMKAWGYIKENPTRVLGLTLKKAILFWGPAEISNNKVIHDDRDHSAVLRLLPGFPVVVVTFVIGVCMFWVDWPGRRRADTNKEATSARAFEASVLILLFIAVYFASFLPFFMAGRYRVPIIPFMLLFSAYAIWGVVGSLASRRFVRATCSVVSGVPLYFLASHPFVPYQPDHAWWHLTRGEAYERRGLQGAAVDEYRSALTFEPDASVTHYKLGQNLAKLERYGQAISCYKRTLELDPNFDAAHTALGLAYGMLDDPESAVHHYRQAVRIAPRNLSAHYNMGTALAHLGQVDEAKKALERALELAGAQGNSDLVERIRIRIQRLGVEGAPSPP